ncbi:hypothetical protein K1719_035893 [Acacia pycnantha]|nr:hypothetical protein K1719_035893 [Acacia pycnantha]
MALAGKLEDEVEVQAPASKRLAHPGSDHVKSWTFTLGGKVVSCKEHFEEIDHENKTCTFNLFDGDVAEKYKSLKCKLKVVDKGSGALVKWTLNMRSFVQMCLLHKPTWTLSLSV